MKQRHKKKSSLFRDIASERMKILFEQAGKRFPEDPSLSDRYIQIARKISMKYKVSFPRELKRRFCKHCHAYLVPGINCRVRLSNRKIVYFCTRCKKFMRIGY